MGIIIVRFTWEMRYTWELVAPSNEYVFATNRRSFSGKRFGAAVPGLHSCFKTAWNCAYADEIDEARHDVVVQRNCTGHSLYDSFMQFHRLQ
ncbi:hypothetical protein AVEN_42041-1 [Araneus ventricosus]|uniref:Uncharacterized protein n=1 Tax=Araneus ventricosus TaxID=182803 RepID=A0A4Y2GFT6_ARAVE|nr:hypothetical protein AVEN_42041-1 [Araneus ventricosus]